MPDPEDVVLVLAVHDCREFGEERDRHHQPLRDDAAHLDGADSDGLHQNPAVLVGPGAEAAVAQEGVAFVVGWESRVDFEIDGGVAGLEFAPACDDAPALALHGDHVESVGVGYRLGGGDCYD